ncbi:MAG: acyltransferase [Lachnospiraceae bacterium]|nr:acyltransferase [Lachnospiraceae bacterium]
MEKRESSIELLRIYSMLIIVMYHYMVNSKLADVLFAGGDAALPKDILMVILCCGGKYSINCFVLITGYFMCKSNISIRKFLKLFLEVELYGVIIYLVFPMTGYDRFVLSDFLSYVFPVFAIGVGFVGSYLAFYWFIPFLNILIKNINKKQHFAIIILSIFFFSVVPTFCVSADVKIGYVGWFMIVYLIGAYIRIYHENTKRTTSFWGTLTLFIFVVSAISTVACSYLYAHFWGDNIHAAYYFLNECNKFFAIIPAISTFIFFKSLKLGSNKVINKIAASSFAVLLIHGHSLTMQRWLWDDVCDNAGWYNTRFAFLHLFVCTIGVYIICTAIDMLRIRFIEKWYLKLVDKALSKESSR